MPERLFGLARITVPGSRSPRNSTEVPRRCRVEGGERIERVRAPAADTLSKPCSDSISPALARSPGSTRCTALRLATRLLDFRLMTLAQSQEELSPYGQVFAALRWQVGRAANHAGDLASRPWSPPVYDCGTTAFLQRLSCSDRQPSVGINATLACGVFSQTFLTRSAGAFRAGRSAEDRPGAWRPGRQRPGVDRPRDSRSLGSDGWRAGLETSRVRSLPAPPTKLQGLQ